MINTLYVVLAPWGVFLPSLAKMRSWFFHSFRDVLLAAQGLGAAQLFCLLARENWPGWSRSWRVYTPYRRLSHLAYLIFEKEDCSGMWTLIPVALQTEQKIKLKIKQGRKSDAETLESKWKIECKKENRTITSWRTEIQCYDETPWQQKGTGWVQSLPHLGFFVLEEGRGRLGHAKIWQDKKNFSPLSKFYESVLQSSSVGFFRPEKRKNGENGAGCRIYCHKMYWWSLTWLA